MKIKTDFDHINELYLVYPKGVKEDSTHRPGLSDYNGLTSFYDELIKLIPLDIKLKLLVKSHSIKEEVKHARENMDVMINSQLTSIWIRDWSGFCAGTKLFKPIFRPKYYYGEYHLADEINIAAYSLHSFMGIDMEELPLILDGGNFVTNGEVAIITRRINKDNKKKYPDEKDIKAIIQDKLKIKPIFVDEMEGEETGHADGCFAFLSKNDIAVSKYPEGLAEKGGDYLNDNAQMLEKEGFTVHRIHDFPDEKKFSAKGLFINFLRLNDTILMPEYSNMGGTEIEKNKKILGKNDKKIVTINCDKLAELGGVLHCISFTN